MKVSGDFKVQFKSDQASFYFWLNVSAILYNEELRKVTEREGLEHDPIHFNEFQEIEETDFRSEKLNMHSLLLPESIIEMKDADLEEDEDSFEQESNDIFQLLQDQTRLTDDFY